MNGRVTTDFDQTPPVSTYLIAFIVSDFECNEFKGTDGFPTTQRVFTRHDYINQTSHALVEAITILTAIGNYVGVPFTLPKLDQVAIPGSRIEGSLITQTICLLTSVSKDYYHVPFQL